MTARSINWAVLVPHGLAAFLAGCGGSQSALNPQGLEAARLAKLFWLFTGVCGAVWVMVMIAMCAAIYAPARASHPGHDPLVVDDGQERANDDFVVGVLATLTASDTHRVHVSQLPRDTRPRRLRRSLSPSRSPAINGGGTSDTKAPTPRRSSTPQTRFTCLSDARSRSTSRPRMSSIASGFPT